MNKKRIPRIPSNCGNFYQCCKLIGHWETKGWRLHLKLHNRNCTSKWNVWRVKVEGKEDISTPACQGSMRINDCSKKYTAKQISSRLDRIYIRILGIESVLEYKKTCYSFDLKLLGTKRLQTYICDMKCFLIKYWDNPWHFFLNPMKIKGLILTPRED
jgi:hypothetical protein